jgi:hypothetical protein
MKSKIFVIILLLLSFAIQTGHAQAPDLLWSKLYGGAGNDSPCNFLRTDDGGFLIGGSTISFGLSLYKYYLIKTDENGDTLWTRLYGRDNHSQTLTCLQHTSDGGYILTGSSGGPYLNTNVYLVRLDINADTLWTTFWGDEVYEEGATWSVQSNDGGIVTTGHHWNETGGVAFVFKTTPDGQVDWSHWYDWPLADYSYCIRKAPEGGYVFTGATQTPDYDMDVLLVRINQDGDTVWTRTFGGTDEDEGYYLINTNDGGYLITGYTKSFGANSKDVYVIKTDSEGDTLWTKIIGDYNSEIGFSAIETTDGGYAITRSTNSFGSFDIFVIKLQSNGQVEWIGHYGDAVWMENGNDIIQTSENEYVVCGSRQNDWVDDLDIFMIKLAPGSGLAESLTNWCSFSVKLNPADVSMSINYALDRNNFIDLSVFDITGNIIGELINEQQGKGVYTAIWKCASVPEGVYMIRLTNGNQSIIRKIIKL